MVDKKACKERKRKKKYTINGAVLSTRMIIFVLIILGGITAYNKFTQNDISKVVESSSYVDTDGISSMVSGVKNGGVYNSFVIPTVKKGVIKATLTRNGEEVRFKSGKKIKKDGSYILTLEDNMGNIDTIYFDIEY